MFVDHAKIYVKAGDGGNGCIAFRREKYVPRGGPSGGNGGRGGDVYFRGTSHLNTLLPLKYRQHFNAARGGHGSGANRNGKSGADLIVEVPVGTQVYDESSRQMLFDLDEPGKSKRVARGGRGGRGNAAFTTSTHQAPREFECGKTGEKITCVLELKVLADVGIIGYPNAGKSTLISTLSSAKPKVADYPFTTLTPNLGVVSSGEYSSFVVADIPGLIEGAHDGQGLGHQFLRHVERTKLLLHLVDVGEGGETDPVIAVQTIKKELELYDHTLKKKSEIIVASKMDIANDGKVGRLRRYCRENELPLKEISAVTSQGIKELKDAVVKQIGGKRD